MVSRRYLNAVMISTRFHPRRRFLGDHVTGTEVACEMIYPGICSLADIALERTSLDVTLTSSITIGIGISIGYVSGAHGCEGFLM